MRILLDVDGVTADFIARTFAELRSLGGPSLTHAHVTSFDILGFMPPEFRDRVKAAWKAPGFCAGIPLIEGAAEGVRMLRELGDVIFVTSPMPTPYWHWERHNWLKEHLSSDGIDVIFATKKEHVVGDVLIDDRVEHLLEWQKAHPQGTPVLWSVPHYARGVSPPPGIISIDNWTDLSDLIRELKSSP